MDYELIEQVNRIMDDAVMKLMLCPVRIGLHICRTANRVAKLANDFSYWWLHSIMEED
ncbi:hypothetical protein LCGC14_1752470 [marine sediment metagenome]|uniref:Uncharacterized protein n=1 Tax=marine sediment metagenome TaxID=412755 RepID=A0A0F9K2V8_9ZZZZ